MGLSVHFLAGTGEVGESCALNSGEDQVEMLLGQKGLGCRVAEGRGCRAA